MIPAGAVERIETLPRVVRVDEQALATSEPVETRVLRVDSPALVRHIPRELDRLVVEGERPSQRRRSGLWIAGAVVTIVALVFVFAGATVTAEVGAPAVAWLWLAAPGAILVLGVSLLWRALGSGDGRQLTRREKAVDAITFLFGITPRTRRRG